MTRGAYPTGSAILQCVGVCLLLVDGASPVNSPSWWDDAIPPSDRMAALARAVAASDIFLWCPMLDGVFRIDFSFGEVPFAIHSNMSVVKFTLKLPTGRLVARSAVTASEVFDVDPGEYHGTFIWDSVRESDHSDLSSIASYPASEGPDGWVFFEYSVSRSVAPTLA